MTTKRRGFTMLPLWLRVSPELSSLQREVYAEIVSYVRDNPDGWPAIGTMARMLSRSDRAVSQAVARLEHHQLIRVERTRGRVSHYSVTKQHAWHARDKAWALARDKSARAEAAQRAAERREERQLAEEPSPWAVARSTTVQRDAEPTNKEPPKLAVVREIRPQMASPAPPKDTEDLRKVEQAWRAAMTRHQPEVPLAAGDWRADSGPGKSAAKLLEQYSTERVLRYVAWVPEAWAGLQRQHPKLSGAPTIGIAASRWSESWMPQALGAVGAGGRAAYETAVANLTNWMREHPETVFAPDELTDAVARASGGKHGRL